MSRELCEDCASEMQDFCECPRLTAAELERAHTRLARFAKLVVRGVDPHEASWLVRVTESSQ